MVAECVTWEPKTYFDNGRFLFWGHDLTSEQVAALKAGEVFRLLDERGTVYSKVLMDSYNQIREGIIPRDR